MFGAIIRRWLLGCGSTPPFPAPALATKITTPNYPPGCIFSPDTDIDAAFRFAVDLTLMDIISENNSMTKLAMVAAVNERVTRDISDQFVRERIEHLHHVGLLTHEDTKLDQELDDENLYDKINSTEIEGLLVDKDTPIVYLCTSCFERETDDTPTEFLSCEEDTETIPDEHQITEDVEPVVLRRSARKRKPIDYIKMNAHAPSYQRQRTNNMNE
jgi:hypothetical protein